MQNVECEKKEIIYFWCMKKTYYKLRKSSKDKMMINSQIMTRLCLVFKVKTQYGKKLTKERKTQTNGWTDGQFMKCFNL